MSLSAPKLRSKDKQKEGESTERNEVAALRTGSKYFASSRERWVKFEAPTIGRYLWRVEKLQKEDKNELHLKPLRRSRSPVKRSKSPAKVSQTEPRQPQITEVQMVKTVESEMQSCLSEGQQMQLPESISQQIKKFDEALKSKQESIDKMRKALEKVPIEKPELPVKDEKFGTQVPRITDSHKKEPKDTLPEDALRLPLSDDTKESLFKEIDSKDNLQALKEELRFPYHPGYSKDNQNADPKPLLVTPQKQTSKNGAQTSGKQFSQSADKNDKLAGSQVHRSFANHTIQLPNIPPQSINLPQLTFKRSAIDNYLKMTKSNVVLSKSARKKRSSSPVKKIEKDKKNTVYGAWKAGLFTPALEKYKGLAETLKPKSLSRERRLTKSQSPVKSHPMTRVAPELPKELSTIKESAKVPTFKDFIRSISKSPKKSKFVRKTPSKQRSKSVKKRTQKVPKLSGNEELSPFPPQIPEEPSKEDGGTTAGKNQSQKASDQLITPLIKSSLEFAHPKSLQDFKGLFKETEISFGLPPNIQDEANQHIELLTKDGIREVESASIEAVQEEQQIERLVESKRDELVNSELKELEKKKSTISEQIIEQWIQEKEDELIIAQLGKEDKKERLETDVSEPRIDKALRKRTTDSIVETTTGKKKIKLEQGYLRPQMRVFEKRFSSASLNRKSTEAIVKRETIEAVSKELIVAKKKQKQQQNVFFWTNKAVADNRHLMVETGCQGDVETRTETGVQTTVSPRAPKEYRSQKIQVDDTPLERYSAYVQTSVGFTDQKDAIVQTDIALPMDLAQQSPSFRSKRNTPSMHSKHLSLDHFPKLQISSEDQGIQTEKKTPVLSDLRLLFNKSQPRLSISKSIGRAHSDRASNSANEGVSSDFRRWGTQPTVRVEQRPSRKLIDGDSQTNLLDQLPNDLSLLDFKKSAKSKSGLRNKETVFRFLKPKKRFADSSFSKTPSLLYRSTPPSLQQQKSQKRMLTEAPVTQFVKKAQTGPNLIEISKTHSNGQFSDEQIEGSKASQNGLNASSFSPNSDQQRWSTLTTADELRSLLRREKEKVSRLVNIIMSNGDEAGMKELESALSD